jgi:hypothetical protein
VAQPHCFTLRLPQDLYIELYELSQSQSKTLNATVIEMIKIAMHHQIDVRQALQQLLDKEFGPSGISANG